MQLIHGSIRSVAVLFMAVAAGCGEPAGRNGIVVMSQNVYFGFDTEPLLAAGSPEEIPILAAQAFQQLLATNFAERAEAIADEIARKRPHLVALQEVALIRIQSPGDSVAGGTTPAETVLYDHLEILQTALASRGLDYRVAGRVQDVDVELPMLTSVDPLSFDDIRLTDYDVVLARGDVDISRVAEVNYQARLFVPSLGLEIPRGYVALDATIGRQSVRFVGTHLEDTPFPDVQLAQAQELAAALALETGTVILVGDLNSPAPGGGAYPFLASQGFDDAWLRNERTGQGSGLTWGHDADLRNPTPAFTVRIDFVLVRESAATAREFRAFVEVWGDDTADRTPSGLWPSDHAGVVAELWHAAQR